MDVIKCLLAARQDKSPQVWYTSCCNAELAPSDDQFSRISIDSILDMQVQELLSCLEDPAFNLQVCICSVGKQDI
jgi:hypothetical protein